MFSTIVSHCALSAVVESEYEFIGLCDEIRQERKLCGCRKCQCLHRMLQPTIYPLVAPMVISFVDVKQLAVISPAIMGPAYFREAAEVIRAPAGDPPDGEKMMDVFRRHGMTLAAPHRPPNHVADRDQA